MSFADKRSEPLREKRWCPRRDDAVAVTTQGRGRVGDKKWRKPGYGRIETRTDSIRLSLHVIFGQWKKRDEKLKQQVMSWIKKSCRWIARSSRESIKS